MSGLTGLGEEEKKRRLKKREEKGLGSNSASFSRQLRERPVDFLYVSVTRCFSSEKKASQRFFIPKTGQRSRRTVPGIFPLPGCAMAEKTVFAQLFQPINRYEFNKCVDRHQGNRGVRNFSCWDQYLAMAFAQLTGRDELRDIEACLNSHRDKLYRMGFRSKVSRSTLADANCTRSYLIYQDFGMHLIERARRL